MARSNQHKKKKSQWRKAERRKRRVDRGKIKYNYGNRIGIDGKPQDSTNKRKKVGQRLPPGHPANTARRW